MLEVPIKHWEIPTTASHQLENSTMPLIPISTIFFENVSKPILTHVIELLGRNRSNKWGLFSILQNVLIVASAVIVVRLNFFIIIINLYWNFWLNLDKHRNRLDQRYIVHLKQMLIVFKYLHYLLLGGDIISMFTFT